MKRTDIPTAEGLESKLQEVEDAIDDLQKKGDLLEVKLTFKQGKVISTIISKDTLATLKATILDDLQQSVTNYNAEIAAL